MLVRILILLALLAAPVFAQRVEPPAERGTYHSAAFPTKAGTYRHKGWRYEYTIAYPGTRSERRFGRLFLGDKEVKGEVGEILEEFLGRFCYFGEHYGWLNTLTYDRPVFDEHGELTERAQEILLSKKTSSPRQTQ